MLIVVEAWVGGRHEPGYLGRTQGARRLGMEGVVIVAFRRALLREPHRLQIAEERHQAFILPPGLVGFGISHLTARQRFGLHL